MAFERDFLYELCCLRIIIRWPKTLTPSKQSIFSGLYYGMDTASNCFSPPVNFLWEPGLSSIRLVGYIYFASVFGK